MPNRRFEPWLRVEEFVAFRELAPEDPDLPGTYEEWAEQINDKLFVFIKSGVPVERVDISIAEFRSYCTWQEINPDGVARAAFAIFKGRAQLQGRTMQQSLQSDVRKERQNT
jgi:hypothetical protein